jgi:hypothetical protein
LRYLHYEVGMSMATGDRVRSGSEGTTVEIDSHH